MGADLSIEKKDLSVTCVTWNLGNNYPKFGLEPYLKEKTDIIAFGVQEANFPYDQDKFPSLDEALYTLILQAAGDEYEVVGKQSCTPRTEIKMTKEEFLVAVNEESSEVEMSGIRLIILKKKILNKNGWGHTDIEPLVQNCGRANGLSGNKGGVAISFRIHGTIISFQNSHLPAHAECLAERVWAFQKVTAGLHDPKGDFEEPPTYGTVNTDDFSFAADYLNVIELSNRSHIFIQLGDFNFRLEKDCENVKKSKPVVASNTVVVAADVANEDWVAMEKYDQLSREISQGRAFFGFQEHGGHPNFRPTFKFDQSNKKKPAPGDNSEYSEKRCPSWCDRVLHKNSAGSFVECTQYKAFHDYKPNTSDHVAVAAYYTIQVLKPVVKAPQKVTLSLSNMTFVPDERAICELFEKNNIEDFEVGAKQESKLDVVQKTKLYVSMYHPAFSKVMTTIEDYATAGVSWNKTYTTESNNLAQVLSYPLMFGVRNESDTSHKGHRVGESSLSTSYLWDMVKSDQKSFELQLMQRGAARGTLKFDVEVTVAKI